MSGKREKPATPWRPPTRRSFVAMLGAAAGLAVIAIKSQGDDAPKPVWIGHC